MAVYIDPYNHPSAGAGYAKVLSDLIGSIQDRQDARDKNMVSQYLSLQPDQQRQMFGQLPDAIKSKFGLIDPNTIPQHVPSTYPEMVADLIAKKKLADLQGSVTTSTLPVDANGNPSFSTMFTQSGAGMTPGAPNSYDRLAAANRVNRYLTGADQPGDLLKFGETAFTQGEPGLLSANRIANKQDLTAQEKTQADENTRDYTNIKLPESQANIANKNAETVKTGADTANVRANTAKTIKETNEPSPSASGSSIVQQVYKNPQSYFSLTKDQKDEYASAGGQPVTRLNADLGKRQFGARAGLDLINDVKGIVDKWHQRGVDITGPSVGRYNEATNSWGGNILPTNLPPAESAEYQSDISKLQEWLSAGKLQEAAALVGSRPAYQTINMLATPGIKSNNIRIDGALEGMRQRLQGIDDQINAAQWGGANNIPQGARGGQYDAKTEAGINNVMKQFHMTREQAVMELRKRNAIQ